jgi:leucyl aminopeptidase
MDVRVVADAGMGKVRVRFVDPASARRELPGVPLCEFSGKARTFFYDHRERVLHVGIGSEDLATRRTWREAAGVAGKFAQRAGVESLVVEVSDACMDFVGDIVDGLLAGNYLFDRFLLSKGKSLSKLTLECPKPSMPLVRKQVAEGLAMGESVVRIREMGNTPGNVFTPETAALEAARIGKESGLKVAVLGDKELTKGAFGGILAVGAGSRVGSRLVAMEHAGGKKGEAPLLFVGKCITFDSGGISIKPAAGMEDMIFDKSGAMAVMGAMRAIAELGVKRNVIGVIAAAENMPGGGAYRPGDIIRMFDGTHVEVVNTDAEGRLVLGDAIAWGIQKYQPEAVVDLATLTGACGVALGEAAAGFFHSDAAWGEAVAAAAERVGEALWHLPIFPKHREQIRSKVADLKNSGGRLAGACTGAAFVGHFSGKTPWAHLDIAYMSHRDKDSTYQTRGATGFGVRLLTDLALHHGR